MQLFIFLLSYPFLWLYSMLPMRVLYVISDIVYFVAYYLIAYRKKVVRQNLELSFPNKTKEELKIIEKKTFQHFIDVIMEAIKSFTISEKELKQRVKLTNPELPNAYFDKNQSVIFLSGHYANWEWVSSAVETSIKYNLSVAYKKFANKYFDKLIKRKRNKFGVTVVPTKEFYPYILNNLKNENYQAYGFIADQSPKLKQIKYWGTFMGLEVPIINGPEIIARKLDLPVFYFHTERVKRGFYQSTFKLLEAHPKKAELNQITDNYIHELEKQIRKNPEYYFWTHKRFKHVDTKPK
jgi:KDO2-lipid IV(A) lauroyltransferase